jgi:hypothetical protein
LLLLVRAAKISSEIGHGGHAQYITCGTILESQGRRKVSREPEQHASCELAEVRLRHRLHS